MTIVTSSRYRPMLAVPSTGASGRRKVDLDALDASGEWAYEPKLDGVRAMVEVAGNTVCITNRNGANITGLFPEIAGPLAGEGDCVLDGEIILIAGGFNTLAHRTKGSTALAAANAVRWPARLVVFDIIEVQGRDLTRQPYLTRRGLLADRMHEYDSPHLQIVPMVVNDNTRGGRWLADTVRAQGGEGIIAKRFASPYRPGRRDPSWVKFKNVHRLTCIAVTYEPGNGWRAEFGAVHLALVKDGKPTLVGRVGSGLSEQDIVWLKALLDAHEFPVVEVECLGRTAKDRLRMPVYLGPRSDRSVLDATFDQMADLPVQ